MGGEERLHRRALGSHGQKEGPPIVTFVLVGWRVGGTCHVGTRDQPDLGKPCFPGLL